MHFTRPASFLRAFFINTISIVQVKLRQANPALNALGLYAIFMGASVSLDRASLAYDSRRFEWRIALAKPARLAETFAVGITVETPRRNRVFLSSNRGGHMEVIQPWVGDLIGINNSRCTWVILQLDHCDIIVGLTTFDFFHRDSDVDPAFG
jgi:hypothetical protein